MIPKFDILEAEKEAYSVINRYKLNGLPICPFTIAQKVDIDIQPKKTSTPGVPGYLIRVGNTFGIQYSTYIKVEGFIRFTVAHELGHYFLPGHVERLFPEGKTLHKSKSGVFSGDPLEEQADHFAKALLMPEGLFVEALRTAGEGFSAVDTLAQKCKTSITATAIRYAQFAEDPVAVIMSTGNRIEWCFLSEPLKKLKRLEWLKKGDRVPRPTLTSEFNQDPEKIEQGEQGEAWTDLDNWFVGVPQLEMREDVVGLGNYSKVLTILSTSEALEEHEEDEDE